MSTEVNPVPGEALNAALAAAQAEFKSIERDKSATVKTQAGGSYSYSWAELSTIIDAVRPVLAKHGLSVMQRFVYHGGVTTLRTELRHEQGGVVGGELPIETRGEPRTLGSLITYYRRYSLCALLNIATEDDVDAPSVVDYLSRSQKDVIEKQRDKLIEAGKFDQKTFDALVADDYNGATVETLSRADASVLIERLDAAQKKIGG